MGEKAKGNHRHEAVLALFERAQRGDASTLPALRRVMREVPGIADVSGNLPRLAEEAWLKLASGTNLWVRESLDAKVAALKAELAGPAPSALERLLVERIAACWLQLHLADYQAANAAGEVTLTMATYLQERQGRAQRRYLAAIRALAQVRRLLLPAVQVNIAERQVNVAVPGAVAPAYSRPAPAAGGGPEPSAGLQSVLPGAVVQT